MKTAFKVFIFIGLLTLGYIAWTMAQDRKKEKSFEQNCLKIRVGMTIQQAIDTMQAGLNNPDFYPTVNTPDSTYITYPIDGGSYLVTVHFDKYTGKVTQIDRPNDEWFVRR